jgi:hypothetical protein
MRIRPVAIALLFLLSLAATAQQRQAYSWVDDEGITHYGDSIPPEYADKPKNVINEHGITVDHIRGKKTAEEIEAERIAAELAMQKELQNRADRALLATYQTVDEIEMHRDRRIELFQAQSRVTESDQAANNVVITNPIASDLEYVDGSAFGPGSEIVFSVDGGALFAGATELSVEENGVVRPARPGDFTHIRWQMKSEIPAGSQGIARFRAKLQ